MSNRLDSLRELAYKEALKGTGKYRHGAVVIGNGGRILSKACNNYDNGLHAEVRALRRIPHDAKESAMELIVVRIRKNQKFGLSKPCPECEQVLRDANIHTVYYSTDSNDNTLAQEVYSPVTSH